MNIIDHDIKLIIGLGNPGKEYINSRHNAGFVFLDALQNKLTVLGHTHTIIDKKEYNIYKFQDLNILLFKSLTFMNLSGAPLVKFLKQQEQIKSHNILAVHDDLDIKLGSYKYSLKSPKQHNGIVSIEQELGTKDFVRLRLGIDNRTEELRNIPGKQYVLGRFSEEELNMLEKSINESLTELLNGPQTP